MDFLQRGNTTGLGDAAKVWKYYSHAGSRRRRRTIETQDLNTQGPQANPLTRRFVFSLLLDCHPIPVTTVLETMTSIATQT